MPVSTLGDKLAVAAGAAKVGGEVGGGDGPQPRRGGVVARLRGVGSVADPTP